MSGTRFGARSIWTRSNCGDLSSRHALQVSRACLVLDFDGTILDTEEPIYRSWSELWEEHGQQLVLAEWQEIIGTDDGFDPWGELQRRLGRQLDPALQERRRVRRDELQARHVPRPGVMAWLEEASTLGVPVGVASSSSPVWVRDHLERLRLEHFFKCVIGSDSAVPTKPDPTSYRLACQELGAEPSVSVAVEDSVHGVAAAVAAGLFTVAVPHALTAGLDLSAANVVAASLDTLGLVDVLSEARKTANSR
jgi:HAD superfamily hydrolase (TIGR01509 family)